MPFDADDMDAFNDTDMPGYAEASLAGNAVAGRFRMPYAEALGIAGSSPTFSAPSSDLTAAAPGVAITIGGTGYTIAGTEPNPVTGQTLLRLQGA